MNCTSGLHKFVVMFFPSIRSNITCFQPFSESVKKVYLPSFPTCLAQFNHLLNRADGGMINLQPLSPVDCFEVRFLFSSVKLNEF
jgi:hypothetical protein